MGPKPRKDLGETGEPKMDEKCPNKGPGAFEGNMFPCIARAAEAWAGNGSEDAQYGDVDAMGEHVAFFKGPFDADDFEDPSVEFAPCKICAAAFRDAKGLSLLTDSQGFRTVEIYASEAEYEVAKEHAENAEAEAFRDVE